MEAPTQLCSSQPSDAIVHACIAPMAPYKNKKGFIDLTFLWEVNKIIMNMNMNSRPASLDW